MTRPIDKPIDCPGDMRYQYVRTATPDIDGKPSVVCVDMDGTLCCKHPDRDIFDWEKVGMDYANRPVLMAVEFMASWIRILITTGRDEICKLQCDMWLRAHGIEYEKIYMRPRKDQRPDEIVKAEILHEIQKDYHIAFALDDRQGVVDMWRANGIPCFQVAPHPDLTQPYAGREPLTFENGKGVLVNARR
jgi:hypothetical protein